MSHCFVCGGILGKKNTQMSTNITPHSKVPYLEKISELLGEEFVIIVNSNDHMCQKCTSMLSHIDKLESDLKLVKNAIMSHIQNKYELLPLGQTVNSVEVNTKELHTNLMTNTQKTLGQFKLPSGVPVKKKPTVVITAVKNPTQILKIQPQQNQKPQQVQQFQKQQRGANSKTFKFSSQYVELQKPTYSNQKEPENPIVTQTATAKITLVPPKKSVIYRCLVCFKPFDNRPGCVEHIQKKHKESDILISNREREI